MNLVHSMFLNVDSGRTSTQHQQRDARQGVQRTRHACELLQQQHADKIPSCLLHAHTRTPIPVPLIRNLVRPRASEDDEREGDDEEQDGARLCALHRLQKRTPTRGSADSEPRIASRRLHRRRIVYSDQSCLMTRLKSDLKAMKRMRRAW